MVQDVRASLVTMWDKVPALIRPAYKAEVSAILCKLDRLADMTKG